jgi:hypothetical protein
MRSIHVSAVFVVTLVLAPSASAQMYKWIDANGVVNYGDAPPDGVKLQPINHGTMSSVADRALVGNAPRGVEAPRAAPGAGAAPGQRRGAGASSMSSGAMGAAGATGGGATDYVPYGPYPLRPLADEAALQRRLAADTGRRPVVNTERQVAVDTDRRVAEDRRAADVAVRPMLPIETVRELPAPVRR